MKRLVVSSSILVFNTKLIPWTVYARLSIVSACVFVGLVVATPQVSHAAPNIGGPWRNYVNPIDPNRWGTVSTISLDLFYSDFWGRVLEFPSPSVGVPSSPGTWTFLRTELRTLFDAHQIASPFAPDPLNPPAGEIHISFEDLQPASSVDLYTFMGRQVGDYTGDVGPLQGFDPNNNPSFVANDFVGLSGTLYPSTVVDIIDASLLASTYPQFDLSSFAGGTGPVTVMSASVIWDDIVGIAQVPEPTAIMLFGSALLLIGGHRSQRARKVE